MKIIILAGGERCGKSTLAKYFKSHGYEYVHFGPPSGSPYQEYRKFIDDILSKPENADKSFVIDRFMYCEFPYSRHYGRQTDMTFDKMNELESAILNLDPGATAVYCETDLDTNWDRIVREGKNEFKSIEELVELRFEYHRVFLNSILGLIEYNFEEGDRPSLVLEEFESFSHTAKPETKPEEPPETKPEEPPETKPEEPPETKPEEV